MAELDYQSLNLFIQRTIDGDSNAFAEIYAGTFLHQYQFAYYFLKDAYKAQDALLQVYSYALSHLATLKDTTQLVEWLEQINYHICYHMLYPSPSTTSAKLIWEMPYLESAIFIMFAYQDMSIRDIALATERSRKDVQKLLNRARKTVTKNGIDLHTHFTYVHIEPSTLDAKGADLILSEVLQKCNYKLQTISISTFRQSHLLKTQTYALQRVILGLILCALLVIPIFFVIPSMDVSTGTNINNGNATYNIKVKSLLRVKSVTAQINGQEVIIYETADKVYTLEPEYTGTATVTVTLENGQFKTQKFKIPDASKHRGFFPFILFLYPKT